MVGVVVVLLVVLNCCAARLDEALRIRHEFLIQHQGCEDRYLPKFRVVFQVLLILRQGRILGEALRDFRMAASRNSPKLAAWRDGSSRHDPCRFPGCHNGRNELLAA